MSSGNNSRTSKVLALSLGQALTAVVSIISGMVAARVLSKYDYATMRQTLLAYQFAAPLLTLALPNALYYFLPREDQEKRGLLIDNLTLLFIMGAVFSFFLLLGGDALLAGRFNNPDLEKTLSWMIPYPLFTMPAAILGAVLVVQGRITTLGIYNVATNLALTCAVIAACLITRSYSGPVWVQILFPILTLPVALLLAFSNTAGALRKPNFSSMKKMVQYSVPLGLASMLGTITLQLDKMIVSSMCTPDDFAVYANGAVEIPLISVITGSIATVILADMANSVKDGDHAGALALFRQAAVRSALILLPVMAFLMVYATDFILLLYSERYIESVTAFRIYLFTLPIRIVVYGSALMALGMTRAVLWRSIFELLLNAVFSIVFVYLFGYIGAAIATILTLYLWSVPFNLHAIAKGFGCHWHETLPLQKIGCILLVAATSATIASPFLAWKSCHPLLRISLAFTMFSCLYYVLSRRYIEEFEQVYLYMKKYFSRIIPENADRSAI